MDSSKQASITPIQQMVSSCSGALITSLFVTPLDVVKIRMQAQDKPFKTGDAFIYHNGLMDVCEVCKGEATCLKVHDCAIPAAKEWYRIVKPIKFNSTAEAFVGIARAEGIPALWSGLSPTLVMAIPATVLYFTSYDMLKYKLGYSEKDSATQHLPIFAGVSARTLTTTMISPLELVRTKMQSQQLTYHEIGKAVRLTVRECGAISLLRGLGPSLLRDVPFSAVYWFGYEYLKVLQMRQAGNVSSSPTFWQSFLAGGAAGTIAAFLTTPFDVIKTHRQIELGKADFSKSKQVTSTFKLIHDLYSQAGVRALYAGLTPRLVKVTPACAIMITSYEWGKNFFRQRNARFAEANLHSSNKQSSAGDLKRAGSSKSSQRPP